jgi:hypothetical protein
MKHFLIVLSLLLISWNSYGQTASRLVAFAKYGADTTLPCTDSGGYNSYSHDRGGGIQPSNRFGLSAYPFYYSYPFTMSFPNDFETGHEGVTKFDSAWEQSPTDTDVSVQFFDENFNIVYSKCRTLTNGAWQDYAAIRYGYDSKNNLVEEVDSFLLENGRYVVVIDQYTYNASAQLSSFQEIYYNNVDTFSFYRLTYTHNNNGQLTDIYDEEWKWAYQRVNSKSLVQFYYTGSKPDSFHTYYLVPKASGTDTGINRVGKYHFSASGDSIITNVYFRSSHHGDILFYSYTSVYDASHNKTMFAWENKNDTFVTGQSQKYGYTYNSFNQVTSEKYYVGDSSGKWKFSKLNRYYYETYEPGPAFKMNDLELYPSPAKNTITLKLEWDTTSAFTCAIFNIAGQRMMQWDEPAVKLYKKTINLPDLASGNYFIIVNRGRQKLVKRFVINN